MISEIPVPQISSPLSVEIFPFQPLVRLLTACSGQGSNAETVILCAVTLPLDLLIENPYRETTTLRMPGIRRVPTAAESQSSNGPAQPLSNSLFRIELQDDLLNQPALTDHRFAALDHATGQ